MNPIKLDDTVPQKKPIVRLYEVLIKYKKRPNTEILLKISNPKYLTTLKNIFGLYEVTKDDTILVNFYEDVLKEPKTGTKMLIKDQNDIIVNGALQPNIFSAIDVITGAPLVLKMTSELELYVCLELNLDEEKKEGLIPAKKSKFYPDPQVTTRTDLPAIIMPMMSGSVSQFPPLPDNLLLVKGTQILNGLKHMHSRGWVHLDVKASNILIDYRGDWHICDFDAAQRINQISDQNHSKQQLSLHFEPRVSLRNLFITDTIDLYMLGLTLLSEKFCKSNEKSLLDEQLNLQWNKVYNLVQSLESLELKDFIHSLLLQNANYSKVCQDQNSLDGFETMIDI